MCPLSDAWWLWHASLQQVLQYFATFSLEILLVEEGRRGGGVVVGECIPATSALQDACCQTKIIQERTTEGDSSSAKYSVLPACFFLFLSPSPPLPRRRRPPPPPPPPLLYLLVDKRLAV